LWRSGVGSGFALVQKVEVMPYASNGMPGNVLMAFS
jgi:hypothetical protein